MGSCECTGNGYSGCKCQSGKNNGGSEMSNDTNSKNNNSASYAWNKLKLPLSTVALGFIIGVSSMTYIPKKPNEVIRYDNAVNSLNNIREYNKSIDRFPLENFDSKVKTQSLDYIVYTLKEDSSELANTYEYKKYYTDLSKSGNGQNLGIMVALTGLSIGLYRLRQSRLSKEKSENKKN